MLVRDLWLFVLNLKAPCHLERERERERERGSWTYSDLFIK